MPPLPRFLIFERFSTSLPIRDPLPIYLGFKSTQVEDPSHLRDHGDGKLRQGEKEILPESYHMVKRNVNVQRAGLTFVTQLKQYHTR